jgi:NitT/TauT family transport system permease protein
VARGMRVAMIRKASPRWGITAIQVAFLACTLVGLSVSHWLIPIVPSGSDVIVAGAKLLAWPDAYWHFAITTFEALLGFAIAAVFGIACGAAVGANRTATDVLNPILLAVYAVPKIIFLPFLMMIFGVGISPKIANAAMHAFFPIMLNSLVGMREVDRIHIKVARSMSASRLRIARMVYLPAMVLPVFAGVRLGLGLAFTGALLAELFESKTGVGFMVIQFYDAGEIAKMLGVVAVVFVLILTVNAGMQRVENWLSRWRRA